MRTATEFVGCPSVLDLSPVHLSDQLSFGRSAGGIETKTQVIDDATILQEHFSRGGMQVVENVI